MITIIYDSIDGFQEVGTFETINEARAFATRWVGQHPEIAGSYAISGDGVGRIMAQGISLDDLFAPGEVA